MRFSYLSLFWLVSVLLYRPFADVPYVLAQPATPRPGANVDDATALNNLRKQLKEANAEPQVSIDAYRKFYEGHPNLDPNIAISVTINIADLYNKLKNTEKVLEIDDWAIKKYEMDPSNVWMLEHKARFLNSLKRHEEAAKVWEDNWNSVVRGGQSREDWLVMYAASTMRQANDAYEALGQPEKSIAMTIRAFNTMPNLLDDKAQGQGGWRNGWMYDSLVSKLLAAKRTDEAQSWGRLQFMECNFDKDCIARATKLLGQMWAEQEAYAQTRLFAQLQDGTAEPTLKNPLADTKLPAFDEKLTKEHVARLQTPPQRPLNRGNTQELISVYIAQGDFAAAMNEARRLLKDNPNSPAGATQICRVFKAADLSTLRANTFLLYLDGKAESPIPAFLKEYENKPVPVASHATVPTAGAN